MNEKRFEYDKCTGIKDLSIDENNDQFLYPTQIVDLLNELNNENKELKEENEQLEKGKMEALSLLGEEIDKNEQLKKDDLLFFQQVFDILMKYQHLFNREMADEVLEDLGIELTEWFE